MSADRPYLTDPALLFHATRATQHVEIADKGKMRARADSSSSAKDWPGLFRPRAQDAQDSFAQDTLNVTCQDLTCRGPEAPACQDRNQAQDRFVQDLS